MAGADVSGQQNAFAHKNCSQKCLCAMQQKYWRKTRTIGDGLDVCQMPNANAISKRAFDSNN
jgi:hypothetical protein